MSHFTVIVIGDDIDEQMAPFAEQDADEEYLQFKDTEDENREEYENKEIDIVVLADGSFHSKYEEQFSYHAKGSFSREWKYPEGSIIRQGKFSEIYPTFEEFMEEWHGTSERDEKMGRYGYWHNPQAHYDWYSVGGRWMGYFKPKAGAIGSLGEPGAFDNTAKNGWVDSIRLCDIDIEGMKADAEKEANETYDKLESVLKGRPLPSWSAIREKHGENIQAARDEYHSLQVVKELNEAQFWSMGDLVEAYGPNREGYVERHKNGTMVPYAFVKDSKWYQKGEMGWFGISSDEMTQDEWNRQFWEMINSLDPQTKLTLLDCHI